MDPIQRLQQVVEAHERQIHELRAAHQQAIDNLRAAHQQQINELRTLSTRPRRPKPSLPDPDKFTGAPFSWDTWLPSIKAKLRIDGEAIGGPEAQFFYTYGRLDGKVQALVSPQLQAAEESQQYDPDALLKQLARIYDDPNKVRDAEDKLQALRQGPDDGLPLYLAKFERLLYKAKANQWPDTSKIALLRQGLNRAARTRLDGQVIVPTDYDGFVNMLQKLGGRIGGGGSAGNTGDPMQIGMIGAIE